MAVGMGAFFIVAVYSLQANLLEEMDLTRRTNVPDMYLIDIQQDQKDGVAGIVKSATGQDLQLIPTVRARIVAINGKEINPESKEYKRDRGRLGFEYTLTYRPVLDVSESILAGKFWDRSSSDVPEVSIEESMRGMMGLDLDGKITFDILGRRITARVTSIRRVDWRNARTGFYVVFRPGTLEKAPNVFIAAINAPQIEPARSRFQRMLVDEYPNVTAIDVTDIVRSLKRILDNVTLAVSFVGGFIFLSGVLILVGSVAMTKFQRIYESAVLKAMGARRKTVLAILTIEYGLLGIVSGIMGSLAGMALSYSISRHVFEIPWYSTPLIYLTGAAATALLVMAIGAASSLDVLNRKPLVILRTQ
jgi:putative ABC transport system permease protein